MLSYGDHGEIKIWVIWRVSPLSAIAISHQARAIVPDVASLPPLSLHIAHFPHSS